jgi:hypothetical protein
LPSVRRHRPGSGSSFLPKYVAYPTAQITQKKPDAVIRYLSIIYTFALMLLSSACTHASGLCGVQMDCHLVQDSTDAGAR